MFAISIRLESESTKFKISGTTRNDIGVKTSVLWNQLRQTVANTRKLSRKVRIVHFFHHLRARHIFTHPFQCRILVLTRQIIQHCAHKNFFDGVIRRYQAVIMHYRYLMVRKGAGQVAAIVSHAEQSFRCMDRVEQRLRGESLVRRERDVTFKELYR